jgi:hypothetical protein
MSTTTNFLTYLNSIVVSVSSQWQINLIYIDISQAFDKIPDTLLPHNLSNFDPLIFMLICSEVAYHPDFLLYALLGTLPQLFPCCQECHNARADSVICHSLLRSAYK